MGLIEDAQGHWALVETEIKKATSEVFFDAQGNEIDLGTLTGQQLLQLSLKNLGLLTFLWGDGFGVLSNNAGEIINRVGAPIATDAAADQVLRDAIDHYLPDKTEDERKAALAAVKAEIANHA